MKTITFKASPKTFGSKNLEVTFKPSKKLEAPLNTNEVVFKPSKKLVIK